MASINLKLRKSLFNEAYLPHLTDYSKRYEVYYGGAGSGKSVFLGQKLLSFHKPAILFSVGMNEICSRFGRKDGLY